MKRIVIPPKATSMPGETPPAVRQARAKQALERAGGRRVCLSLPAEAIGALAAIQARDSANTTQAVIAALLNYAKEPVQ